MKNKSLRSKERPGIFWLLFNLVGRVFGVLLLTGGPIMSFGFIGAWVTEATTFNLDYSEVEKPLLVAFPILFAWLGWMLIKADPF